MAAKHALSQLLVVTLVAWSGCDGMLVGPGAPGASTVSPFSNGTVLTCESLVFERRELLDGQSAQALATRELSGRQDVWEDYVEFSRRAVATCSFSLPAQVAVSEGLQLTLRTNYRGPRRSRMQWLFEVWDAVHRRWEYVGDNSFARSWVWAAATFELPAPVSRFISDGGIRLRYRATSKKDASLLDEWVLLLSGGGVQVPDPDPAPDPDPDPAPDPDPEPAPDPDSGAPAPQPDPDPEPDSGAPAPSPAPSGIWQPTPGTSWQWQLTGTVDTSLDVQMFDIDLFESSTQLIAGIQAKGSRVVCYFSTAYENWRPDASGFPSSVLGKNLDGWPGERWVDIRSQAVRDIMVARLDLAQQKGCDGVEPDNVDPFQQSTGFSISASDNLGFLTFLAAEAHARGLAIALKNNVDQVQQLEPFFDFAVNEECFQYNECDTLTPFIDASKAVFHVEYGSASLASSICPQSAALGFDTLIKKLDLDAWRVACP